MDMEIIDVVDIIIETIGGTLWGVDESPAALSHTNFRP